MPVRKKIANNSASDSDFGPFFNNFSRGRSLVGQSVIAIIFLIIPVSMPEKYRDPVHYLMRIM